MIIHLNGWQGAGKKTIGQILARRLNARFIHNHLLHDVAFACAGFDEASGRWELYEAVRAAAYATLAKQPRSEIFVMTNGLCNNTPRDHVAWEHVVDLAIARQAPLIPVVLKVDLDENCRRIQSADRIGKKATDPEALRRSFAMDTIQEPDLAELLIVDASNLSAEQAAAEIYAHIAAIKDMVHPATLKHLHMR